MKQTIALIPHGKTNSDATASVKEVDIAGDVNPCDLNLSGVERVNLQFPKFTDGRAYSRRFCCAAASNSKGKFARTAMC